MGEGEEEGLMEEKQLLAVHCMLQADVQAEMERVALLLWSVKSRLCDSKVGKVQLLDRVTLSERES